MNNYYLQTTMLSKKYGQNYAVNKVNLHVKQGDIYGLIGHPDFLILDEPINGLDPQGITEIRELILKLNREQNMTILISSHILEELGKVATVFGIIAKGELVMELSQEELRNKCEERVEIVSSDSGAVVTVLESMGIMKYSAQSADTIYAYGCAERVGEITKQLVNRGISIHQIHTAGTSLEEFFLQTIGKGGKRS